MAKIGSDDLVLSPYFHFQMWYDELFAMMLTEKLKMGGCSFPFMPNGSGLKPRIVMEP